ncbi:hypothetical protein V8C42DRAFT_275523 [Trichoderma barbatum]
MEPLGIFSSAGTTADLCKKLLVLCKNVRNAGIETDQLRRSVASLEVVLKSVEEMRNSPNSAKLKHIHQLAGAIDETQLLLQKLVADLSPDTAHKVFRKIKGSSIKWPFEKGDILKRIHSLERCIQIITEGLQVDQTTILLDIDYRAVLDRLPVASDAYFDSFDESCKAKCLPETRVDLLRDVSNWANNPDSQAIFWLNGMAGTGKSTISRTISETLASENRLAASFFFKRGEADRGGLAKFFTTIAADLVQRQPRFGPRVKEAIDAEPGISTKSASDQFKKLIVGPLSEIPEHSSQVNPIVIVVDALDECDRDKDIELLIWLFSRSPQPSFPRLKFFLTSRPELPLRLGFKKIEGTYKDLILHEVPAPIIENDISTFLAYELSIVRKDYNISRSDDLRLPESWPGDGNMEILVRMAIPLFIFASTTCRFIADRKHGTPQRQLQRVLEYQTKATGSRLDATYLPILDQQIDGLSDREKADVATEFRAIVGAIIVLAKPLSTTALSLMLEIPKDTIVNRLEMLHSVLSVPASLNMPVRMLHLSFRDFLLDPEKRDKTPLWIEEREAHAKMAHHCLRLLDNLKSDICNLELPGISTADIPRARIDAQLSPELQYACLYWVSHVQQSETRLVDGGPVASFLLCHFLHWLEALSLMGRTREILGFIKALQKLVEPEAGIKTFDFLHDAKLFALAHAATIESWPLQTYSSALVFTPTNSIVRAHFEDSLPPWISSLPLVDYSWDPCKQVLDGHSGYIRCTVFSHDSTLLASGGNYHIVRVWDVDRGELLQQMTGHAGSINSVNFSHDSSLLLSASSDSSIRIWHTETGDCIRVLDGHSGVVVSAVFSHDSTLIASGSSDETVRIWDVETGECKHTLLGHKGYVVSVAFSHDSTLVASASHDGVIRIWHTESGACKSILQHGDEPLGYDDDDGDNAHDYRPNGAFLTAFSPDSTRLASLYDRVALRLWRVDTGTCERRIQLGDPGLEFGSVSLSHDWKYCLSTKGGEDEICLWRVDTEQCVQTFNGQIGFISSLAFSHNSTSFAASSRSSAIGIWDITEQGQKQPVMAPATIDKHSDIVRKVVFSQDSSLVATLDPLGHMIMIWSAMTGCCIQKLEAPGDSIGNMVLSHDNSLVASISSASGPFRRRGHICFWETGTGLCVADFATKSEYITMRIFSPDLKFLAVHSGTTIELWHMNKGICVRTFDCGNILSSVVFLDDSKSLGASTNRGTVFLWDTETGNCFYQHCMPDIKINTIAFSHDLTLMAIATYSNDVHIICRDNGKCVQIVKTSSRLINSLGFTYDGSCIGVSADMAVGVWRIDTGEKIHNMHPWRMGRYLKFAVNKEHSSAYVNNNDENDKFSTRNRRCCGYALDLHGRWITWGEHKLLRLPKRYEVRKMDADDTTIILKYNSGRVIVIATSTKDLPDFEHLDIW